MAGINYGRVLMGALVAGVVANAIDFVSNMFILADDMVRMAQRLNLDQQLMNSPAVAACWAVVDFLYAFVLVWTYAAIRPRFGPGPKTAATAGVVIWFAVTIILFGFHAMGIFTKDMFMKAGLLALVNTVVTSLVGAYFYKE
jgi:hypothetical protein